MTEKKPPPDPCEYPDDRDRREEWIRDRLTELSEPPTRGGRTPQDPAPKPPDPPEDSAKRTESKGPRNKE